MDAKYELRVPVALFFYNRVDLLSLLLRRINQVYIPKLFLISDGPDSKKPTDLELVKSSRDLFKDLKNVGEIVPYYREENVGLYKNVKEGIDFVFSHTDAAIFLEDDVIPDISFFPFCEEMLEVYRNKPNIFMIQGAHTLNSTKAQRLTRDSYFFSRYPSVGWGWASWGHKWAEYYDGELKSALPIWERREIMNKFKKRSEYEYWSEKFNRIRLTRHTWDAQVILAFFLHNLFSVVPSKNLVKNMGLNRPDATHTTGPSIWETLPLEAIDFPLIHPKSISANKAYDKLRSDFVAPSIFHRIHKRIFKMFRRKWKNT